MAIPNNLDTSLVPKVVVGFLPTGNFLGMTDGFLNKSVRHVIKEFALIPACTTFETCYRGRLNDIIKAHASGFECKFVRVEKPEKMIKEADILVVFSNGISDKRDRALKAKVGKKTFQKVLELRY